ncbi:MAG: beta-galactosidase [Prevotellaceae bacterium]|nr:beta-galactosidase [Prevotellaceae bacterium]
MFFGMCIATQAQAVPEVKWDAKSLIINGKRVAPVMGEIHYSRLPKEEWATELHKMKEGGVTLVANYVFWNHVEEEEGIFDWSGQRSLREFLECCKSEELPVVLRIGPFCHGEARNGGIPDWVVDKGMKLRSEDPQFLHYTEVLYRQIFTQVQGLQWKDGGPVIACQFDNEYRGSGSYLMALKRIALGIGFDLPFYTRTGWPELSKPVPFGEMIPLYGDYADGFWERSLEETAGNYWQAFNFKAFRSSTAIASEQIDYSGDNPSNAQTEEYPYFTCELGGGMMTSYHRRVYLYPEDAYSLAIVKLGSGSNLLGYYMYHGGTNPDGKLTYLNENQRTKVTNYNDLPVKTYDFQAPLGEFGQKNPHYYTLRKLHLFMHDFAEELAPMEATFPNADKPAKKGDDSYLRWAYRSDGGNSAFIFINNYERLQNLTAKKVQFDVCGVQLPKLTIPAGTMCIFPINVANIRYATAQLIARRNGNIYMEQIPGIPTDIAIDGKVLKNVKAKGLSKPVYKNIYLLNSHDAAHLFLAEPATGNANPVPLHFQKTKEAHGTRQITIGVNKVAEEPTDADFDNAATYTITLPAERDDKLLKINYQGDCARLYANGRLIDDNFYNGRPFLYGLWRLPSDVEQLELRILPMQENAPIYFPREADTTVGERVDAVTMEQL